MPHRRLGGEGFRREEQPSALQPFLHLLEDFPIILTDEVSQNLGGTLARRSPGRGGRRRRRRRSGMWEDRTTAPLQASSPSSG